MQYNKIYEHFTCFKKLNGILSRAEHTHNRTDIILSVTTSYYVFFPSSSAAKNPPVLQETWVPSLDQEDPLEKEMAIHSSILVWEIPGTEGPGRLQSMGSQKNKVSEWLSD